MTYFDYDGFADGLDGQLNSWDVSIERLFEQSHLDLQVRLEAELDQIDQQLEQRDEIHIEIALESLHKDVTTPYSISFVLCGCLGIDELLFQFEIYVWNTAVTANDQIIVKHGTVNRNKCPRRMILTS